MKRVGVALVAILLSLFVPMSAGALQQRATPSCTNLVVGTTTVEGADGSGYLTVLFADDGATCYLQGYPTIQFFEMGSTHLIGHDVHRTSMVFAGVPARRVTLKHGKVASVGMTWVDDPKPGQSCPSARWVSVVLPDSSRVNYQPSLNAKPCGSTVWVTPFENGAQPKLVWNAAPS